MQLLTILDRKGEACEFAERSIRMFPEVRELLIGDLPIVAESRDVVVEPVMECVRQYERVK
ncbi:hypothetical protein [Tamilnaduibacter salinus]|uniref:hypothetical protein n=1 Tax=Tamilnaduibacter salinus TaxID=1484056 RepID=UPI0011806023|nr:hypothetical protein [Tamilnaduibacter salinus]